MTQNPNILSQVTPGAPYLTVANRTTMIDKTGATVDIGATELIVTGVDETESRFQAGDPLSYVTAQDFLTNVLEETDGPLTFKDYNPILPPNLDLYTPRGVVLGKGTPGTPTGNNQGSRGRVQVNDRQNPVHFAPSALQQTNSQGENAPIADGPSVTQLGGFNPVKSGPMFGGNTVFENDSRNLGAYDPITLGPINEGLVPPTPQTGRNFGGYDPVSEAGVRSEHLLGPTLYVPCAGTVPTFSRSAP